jgi:ferritin
MLSSKLNAALNSQMNKEFFAGYQYLAATAFFEDEELGGFAHFFRIQAAEELQHAMKIFDYIHRVGGAAKLEAVSAPKRDFKAPVDVFRFGLKNEIDLAKEIDELLALAISEKHAPTQVFLQWFINEQVEEEALFTRAIKRLERAADSNGILLLDEEFARRQPEKQA